MDKWLTMQTFCINLPTYCMVIFQSLLLNIFQLVLFPQLFFSLNYRRNRLLRVSFVELNDFIIYQYLNKGTKILSLATSHIAIVH